jgi:hypothetical protein
MSAHDIINKLGKLQHGDFAYLREITHVTMIELLWRREADAFRQDREGQVLALLSDTP